MPANHCRTPRLWTENHQLSVGSNTASHAPSLPHERPTTTCFNTARREARPPRCWPAQSQETSLGWFSDRTHASAPRSATRKPTPLAEKEFSTPLPDSFYQYLAIFLQLLTIIETGPPPDEALTWHRLNMNRFTRHQRQAHLHHHHSTRSESIQHRRPYRLYYSFRRLHEVR